MSRWKVYKDNEDRAWRWIAAPDHASWWEEPQGRRFPQWSMAMRYATRMSRPSTLTVKDRSGEFCDLTATVDSWHFIHLKAGDDTFDLARHEWKPLAHFLLDAAKYQKEE